MPDCVFDGDVEAFMALADIHGYTADDLRVEIYRRVGNEQVTVEHPIVRAIFSDWKNSSKPKGHLYAVKDPEAEAHHGCSGPRPQVCEESGNTAEGREGLQQSGPEERPEVELLRVPSKFNTVADLIGTLSRMGVREMVCCVVTDDDERLLLVSALTNERVNWHLDRAKRLLHEDGC